MAARDEVEDHSAPFPGVDEGALEPRSRRLTDRRLLRKEVYGPMTDPQPTENHSTSWLVRLWRAAVAMLHGAVPADDPWCEHGYGAGYCLDDPTCDHFDRRGPDA